MPALASPAQTHPAFGHQVHELLEELEGEFEREMHHDNSQSDKFMRKHVMALIVILYGLVALILTAGIGFIALYYRPHI